MSAIDETNYTCITCTCINVPEEHSLTNRDFQIWQQTRVIDLYPVIVLDILYMLFGVVGNSIVCYICMFRMDRTVINNYVLSLGILELLGCIFMIPVDITEILNAYVLDFPVLCKSEKYFRTFVIFSTTCILVAIATERYQRIVKPHGRHMTLCQFRFSITSAIVISAVLAIPEAVLAGSETVQTSFGVGVVCSAYNSDKYRCSILPKLWGLFVIVVYLLSIASITAIYFMIASKIWKKGKAHTDRRSTHNTPNSTLQRRVRCSSFHQSKQGEPQLGAIERFSMNFSERLHSAFATSDRISSSSYTSLAGMNDIDIPRKTSRVKEYEHVDQEHCNENDNSTFRLKVNEKSNKSNTIQTKSEPDLLRHVPNDNTGVHLQMYHQQCDNKNDTSSQCHRLICNRSSHTCSTNCHTLTTHNSQNKIHQEDLQQPAVFFNAFIKQFNQRAYGENIQRRHRYIQENPQTFLRPIPHIATLRRKSGYSRKRTTFIMFVITLTTVFSHLPHIVVMLYSLIHPGVKEHLTADESVVFSIAWNSFFISLATHPFMYGFWNGRFKSVLFILFKRFKRTKDKEERPSNSSGRLSLTERQNCTVE